MGAWGTGSFENDDALDWVWELTESDDLDVVIAALGDALEIGDDYLDATACCRAIAAAEVIAALEGRTGALPDDVAAWVAAHGDLDATPAARKARQAVHQILDASELKELWEEADDNEGWVRGMNGLLARLRS